MKSTFRTLFTPVYRHCPDFQVWGAYLLLGCLLAVGLVLCGPFLLAGFLWARFKLWLDPTPPQAIPLGIRPTPTGVPLLGVPADRTKTPKVVKVSNGKRLACNLLNVECMGDGRANCGAGMDLLPQDEALADLPLPVVTAEPPVTFQTAQEALTTAWAGEWSLAYPEGTTDEEEAPEMEEKAWVAPPEADRGLCGGPPLSCLAPVVVEPDPLDRWADDGGAVPTTTEKGTDHEPEETALPLPKTPKKRKAKKAVQVAADGPAEGTPPAPLSPVDEDTQQDPATAQERDRTVEAMPPLPSPHDGADEGDGLDALSFPALRKLAKGRGGPKNPNREALLEFLRSQGVTTATTE